jgi:circadian clock protein KaiB
MTVAPLVMPIAESVPQHRLKLFVTTWSCPCQRAIQNLSALLKECFPTTYQLDIIDISKNPGIAIEENIFCVPVLVKDFPKPRTCLIGDMSDRAKVLAGLALQ